jgi:hypothetical protein
MKNSNALHAKKRTLPLNHAIPFATSGQSELCAMSRHWTLRSTAAYAKSFMMALWRLFINAAVSGWVKM